MASTLTKILLHITMSTRNREPLIAPDAETSLYAYIGGICRRMDSPLLAMGGTADHVHMLVSMAKTISLSDLMLNIKRDSSKWIKTNGPALASFRWQDGYFAFSIGESGVTALRTYITHQKEHHKAADFKDEVRAFLARYGIEWDERYIWH